MSARKNVTMYRDVDEDIKSLVKSTVIDGRNASPPKTYKECATIVKKKYDVIVTRNNIYNITKKKQGIKKKSKPIRSVSRSSAPIPFDDARQEVKDSVVKKIINMFVQSDVKSELSDDDEIYTSTLKYSTVADKIKKDFNVNVDEKWVKGILLSNFSEVKAKVKARRRAMTARKKRRSKPRPRNKCTMKVNTNNGARNLEYEICNVVFSGTINISIDIDAFMDGNPDAIYNPAKFPGIVIKIEDPPSSVLLFKTGRFVSVGLREIENIGAIKKELHERIESSGFEISEEEIEADVKNVVLTTSLPDESERLVDLNLLGLMLTSCMYEPEVFPGLIYKLRSNSDGTGRQRAVFLIFSSKKVVCVGIRDVEEIPEILTDFIKSIDDLGEEVYIKKFSEKDIPDELRFLDLS
jgi:transcription initiation factor TFIID TATA-box-binding protein